MFAVFAWMNEPNIAGLAVVISADNVAMGIAGTALIAYLSSLTSASYTATQYALFSSMYALPGKLLMGTSGFVVDAIGYPRFFVYTSALGLPALVLLFLVARSTRKRTREAGGGAIVEEVDLARVICPLHELADPGREGIHDGGGRLAAARLRGAAWRQRARLREPLSACRVSAQLEPGRSSSLPDAPLILCAMHGALFEIETGLCLSGPCDGLRSARAAGARRARLRDARRQRAPRGAGGPGQVNSQ